MKTYTLKAVPTAGAVEPKNNNKAAKAKRILVGVDVHLRGYHVPTHAIHGSFLEIITTEMYG